MALDLDAVAIQLAAVIDAAQIQLNGLKVNVTDFAPLKPTPPHFFVADWEAVPHKTFGGLVNVTFKLRLLVGLASASESQRLCRQVASMTGDASMMAALEAARGAPGQPALDGLAQDLVAQGMRGPQVYEVGGADYLGVEFTVFVMG